MIGITITVVEITVVSDTRGMMMNMVMVTMIMLLRLTTEMISYHVNDLLKSQTKCQVHCVRLVHHLHNDDDGGGDVDDHVDDGVDDDGGGDVGGGVDDDGGGDVDVVDVEKAHWALKLLVILHQVTKKHSLIVAAVHTCHDHHDAADADAEEAHCREAGRRRDKEGGRGP